jgi:signal transduction histidine kinase/CheY-like chemotaxis protein
MSDPAIAAIQILFGLLFLWALWVAARHCDQLALDVVLVLAPIAIILAIGPLEDVVGALPTWLRPATTAFLIAQPVFSLKLVADIRGLPARLLPIASAAALIGAAAVVISNSIPVALVAIGVFIVTELIAAGFLAIEARRRSGAARIRLALAATATAAVAGALLTLGASAAGPDAAAAAGVAIRLVTLLAAVAYWVAFLPPRSLRRFWQESTAFRHSERLYAAPPTTRPAALWADLATTASETTGADTVIVLDNGSGLQVAASSNSRVEPGLTFPGARLPGLREGAPFDPVMGDLCSRTGSRSAKVVALAPEGTHIGAVILLRPRSSLFDADDVELVQALGIRSAHLVQRREVLAEQEALSQRLTQTVAALEAASAAKSDFLASMSHELRTPLNAIMGFSALMTTQSEVDGELTVPREWVEHIRNGGDHLLSLINDLLDLAKVEAGRLELDYASVDVGHAIASSVAGLHPLADRKHLKVEVTSEAAIVIDADPGRLRQILYNLLSNAIKYTPDGGSIRVAGTRLDSEVRISVQDSGIGIAQIDHARVFEEFRQVGDTRQHQSGTGLGLALTKRLVEAHGGRIELDSELGSGSTFTVVLPDRAVRTFSGERSDDRTGEPAGSSAADILVIEDEPSSARLLQTYLAEAGHGVRLAHDGETGLAMARAIRPAAIVLDILLPGIDGWEVLRQLKSDPDLRDVPVIIATVVDERGVGLALGAVDYLVKPINPEALLDRLARYTFTTQVKTRTMGVLAIDDDPAALDVIEATLAPLGFSVCRASSGREGIALARSSGADLVICDLMMPDVDGFEVVSELRGSANTAAIPILILTAHDLSPADKARLNGRVLGIATKSKSGVDGLSDWLTRVLPAETSAAPR